MRFILHLGFGLEVEEIFHFEFAVALSEVVAGLGKITCFFRIW